MKNLSKEELLSRLEAINKSNAIIYFDLDGYILGVNSIFLKAMGSDLLRRYLYPSRSLIITDTPKRKKQVI